MANSRQMKGLVLGCSLGYVLSCCGFTDYGEMLKMLTLSDFRLMLVFMAAVALTAVGVRLDTRLCPVTKRRVRLPVLVGACIFGVGWALAGACPAVPLVQLGEGKLSALVTIVGVSIGMTIQNALSESLFRWERESCAGD